MQIHPLSGYLSNDIVRQPIIFSESCILIMVLFYFSWEVQEQVDPSNRIAIMNFFKNMCCPGQKSSIILKFKEVPEGDHLLPDCREFMVTTGTGKKGACKAFFSLRFQGLALNRGHHGTLPRRVLPSVVV